MLVTASCVRNTVWSPLRALTPASSAMPETRWALSAICRAVATNSFMVVAISFIAAVCSRTVVVC